MRMVMVMVVAVTVLFSERHGLLFQSNMQDAIEIYKYTMKKVK